TGDITGTPSDVLQTTESQFTVRAMSDLTSIYNDRQFSITVADNLPPVWFTPAGSLGVFENDDEIDIALIANDPEGDTPITYTNIAGSLPDGLTLNSDGTITGTITGILEDADF